jgi:hypothetical protein
MAVRKEPVSDASRIKPRFDLLANPITLRLSITKVGVYFIAVVQIVGYSGVYVGKIQNRVLLCDFLGSGAIKKREQYRNNRGKRVCRLRG